MKRLVAALLVPGVLVMIAVSPPGHITRGATHVSGLAKVEMGSVEGADPVTLRWLFRSRWWRRTPEPPVSPELSDIWHDRLTVSWTPPLSVAFDIVDYDVQFRASKAPRFVDWIHHGNATEATITGLAEDTEYLVRVRAVNDVGEGDWSAIAIGATRQREQFAEEVFQTLASPVVRSKCLRCHARGGVADQTRLVFVTDAQTGHESMNLRVFEEFLSEVESGAALILDKIQDATHGGGVQVEAGTEEFAAIERLLTVLSAFDTADDVFVYRLVGENPFSLAGYSAANVGDMDGDGLDELIVGSPNFEDPVNPAYAPGKAYLVSGRDLLAADLANGQQNQVISLWDIAGQSGSWTIVGDRNPNDYVGSAVAAAGDHTGDGLGDVWVGARGRHEFAGEVYLVSQAVTSPADEGIRQFDLSQVSQRANTWVLVGEESHDNAGRSIARADIEGDGLPDVLVGAPFHGGGAVYVVSGKSLTDADAVDGEVDRRVGLKNIAAQASSWKLLSEGEDDHFGIQVAGTGDIDGDGREDFLISATGRSRSAVYLVGSSSLEGADAADGTSDGLVQTGHVVDGTTSWKLLGEPGGLREGRVLAANDLDGDGDAELLIGSRRLDRQDAVAYILAVSDLPAADAADGVADGVVELERAAMEAGSHRLTGNVGSELSITSMDFDGDDRVDVIVGAPRWTDRISHRSSTTEIYTPGAVYLLSGVDIAAASAEGGSIDLEEIAQFPKSWKVIGESGMASDRLGKHVGAAGDLDGDGIDELAFGNPGQLLPNVDAGVFAGPGSMVVFSGKDLAIADSRDGSTDGVVHLNSLDISHLGGELPEPSIVEEYDDYVVVMNVPRAWSRVNGLRLDYLARLFLTEYDDVFDYLMFVSNLPSSDSRYYYAGDFSHLSNADEGIGVFVIDYMAANRLRGLMHFTYLGAIDYAGAHEIMHSWANFVLAVNDRPHWGFSSANGQLGGFDLDNLVDLGDGRYTAGEFSRWGNDDVPYSPLELYLAGWISPEEVPDFWFARDGQWTGQRDDDGVRIFSSSNPETWTVERLVEEYGVRTPTHENSQRTFRAAAILMVEEEHPDTDAILGEFAEEVRRFAHRGNDDHEAINFWEATAGRASINLGDLSKARRTESAVARRRGALPAMHRDRTASDQRRVIHSDKPPCPEPGPTIDHFDDRPGPYPPRGRK